MVMMVVNMSIIMMVDIDSVQSYNICQGHFSELFLSSSHCLLVFPYRRGHNGDDGDDDDGSGEDEHNLDGGPQLVVVVISITSYYTASAKVT